MKSGVKWAALHIMKDLLGIRPLNTQMILDVLDRADGFLPLNTPDQATLSRCAGQTLVNLFFEASTRTRTSFELAAKRLGMEVVNLVVGASSVTKGETLRDTILTLDAMRPDAVVVRHSTSGVPAYLANFSQAHFINAGDGAHEHPTQALLDALTIRRHFGKIAGLTVAILGDVLHSRVARSNVHLLTKLGAQVRISGPRTLLADGIEHLANGNAGTARVYTSIQAAVTEADAIMMLRIQRERQNSAFLPTLGEYFKFYGLNQTRLQLARPNAIVLHPGPINRNVEIASEIADSVQSKILEQVQNGVAVRMAVLDTLLHS